MTPMYTDKGDITRYRPRGSAFAHADSRTHTYDTRVNGNARIRPGSQDSPCPETQTDAALDAARSRVSPAPGPVYLGSASHADG